jgi:endonuclease/exonuclease/phosphatase (EEP) superfamily protein YafD
MRSAFSRIALQRSACRLLRPAAWACLAVMFTWLAAYLAAGDRFGYLALANLLAVYLFFPLPLVLLAALLCRSRWLGIGFVAGLAAFLWLWGAQFLPGRGGSTERNPSLSVMTYNVLAWHEYTRPVLDTIRSEDPDIVCLQELNHNLAQVLETEMAGEYPYQALEPVDNPSGIGVISKIPFRPASEAAELRTLRRHSWVGGPVIVTLDWNGQTLSLVNFHMRPTTVWDPGRHQ